MLDAHFPEAYRSRVLCITFKQASGSALNCFAFENRNPEKIHEFSDATPPHHPSQVATALLSSMTVTAAKLLIRSIHHRTSLMPRRYPRVLLTAIVA